MRKNFKKPKTEKVENLQTAEVRDVGPRLRHHGKRGVAAVIRPPRERSQRAGLPPAWERLEPPQLRALCELALDPRLRAHRQLHGRTHCSATAAASRS